MKFAFFPRHALASRLQPHEEHPARQAIRIPWEILTKMIQSYSNNEMLISYTDPVFLAGYFIETETYCREVCFLTQGRIDRQGSVNKKKIISMVPFKEPEDSFSEKIASVNNSFDKGMPPVKEAQRWVREMVNMIFPVRENMTCEVQDLEESLEKMKERLARLLVPLSHQMSLPAAEVASRFFDEMPGIFDALMDDARAFVDCDPAAENIEEVILCYPGFFALSIHRMSHVLYKLNVPVLPRIISEYAHTKTGIDIHPGATIGRKCFIDHGTGIVIGETANVGDNVKIYQGVTLGALYVKKNLADTKRHPTIGDNVILYAGCTILGGETLIGRDTIVGGNVWLMESVGRGSIVYRENKIRVKEKEYQTHTIDYII